jgi:hypothetical protein
VSEHALADDGVHVEEKAREAAREVREEAVRHAPDVPLHVFGQVLIVVFLSCA